MFLIPLTIGGLAVIVALSPEAATFVSERVASLLRDDFRATTAAAWFDGHRSIGLMYLSGAFFFISRTVSRLLDK